MPLPFNWLMVLLNSFYCHSTQNIFMKLYRFSFYRLSINFLPILLHQFYALQVICLASVKLTPLVGLWTHCENFAGTLLLISAIEIHGSI